MSSTKSSAQQLSPIPEEYTVPAARVTKKRKTFTSRCVSCAAPCKEDELEVCDCTPCSRPGMHMVLCGPCADGHRALDKLPLQATPKAGCVDCSRVTTQADYNCGPCTARSVSGGQVSVCRSCIHEHLRVDNLRPSKQPAKKKAKRTVTLCDVGHDGSLCVYEVSKLPAGGIERLRKELLDNALATKKDYRMFDAYKRELQECEWLWGGNQGEDPLLEEVRNELTAIFTSEY